MSDSPVRSPTLIGSPVRSPRPKRRVNRQVRETMWGPPPAPARASSSNPATLQTSAPKPPAAAVAKPLPRARIVRPTPPDAAEPVALALAATEPVTLEPAVAEPVAPEPVAPRLAVAEPVAPEPVATEPVATEPVATELAVVESEPVFDNRSPLSQTIDELLEVAGITRSAARSKVVGGVVVVAVVFAAVALAASGDGEPADARGISENGLLGALATLDEPTVETPAPVVPETSTVMLWSTPPGAEVLNSDGVVVGTTPHVIEGTPGQDATHYLRLDGYRAAVIDARLPEAGATDTRTVALKTWPALKITSKPRRAAVRIPELDLDLGKTPLTWQPPDDVVTRIEGGETFTVELKRRGVVTRHTLTAADLEATDGLSVRLRRPTKRKRRIRPTPPPNWMPTPRRRGPAQWSPADLY